MRLEMLLSLLLCAICPLVLPSSSTPSQASDDSRLLQVTIPTTPPLSAVLGGSLTLPCLVSLSYPPPNTNGRRAVLSLPRVKWSVLSQGHETEILVARGDRVKVSEAYKDRASLLHYASSPADLTLRLEGLQYNDSGFYRCEVQQGLEDADDVAQVKVKGVVFHYRDASSRYAFTFAQARDACEEIGAHIATPEQLLAAYHSGYEQCDAGWLSDHSVSIDTLLHRYPIQMPREGCFGDMDGHPGVRNYGLLERDELYDVYCYVENIEGEVFHGSAPQSFTLWEAKAYCLAQGAELATTGQLYAAWNDGLNACSPGWLADGSVRYPIVTPRERCGGGEPGVRTVYRHLNQTGFPEAHTRHDTYCFRGNSNTHTESPHDYLATEPEDIGQDIVTLSEPLEEFSLGQVTEQVVSKEAQGSLTAIPVPEEQHPSEHIEEQGAGPGEQYPEQGAVPGEQHPEQRAVPGEQYPEQGAVPGEQYPEQVAVPGEQYPEQVAVPGEQYPEQVAVPGEQYPEQVAVPGEQYPEQVAVPREQYPEEVAVSGEHGEEQGFVPGEHGEDPFTPTSFPQDLEPTEDTWQPVKEVSNPESYQPAPEEANLDSNYPVTPYDELNANPTLYPPSPETNDESGDLTTAHEDNISSPDPYQPVSESNVESGELSIEGVPGTALEAPVPTTGYEEVDGSSDPQPMPGTTPESGESQYGISEESHLQTGITQETEHYTFTSETAGYNVSGVEATTSHDSSPEEQLESGLPTPPEEDHSGDEHVIQEHVTDTDSVYPSTSYDLSGGSIRPEGAIAGGVEETSVSSTSPHKETELFPDQSTTQPPYWENTPEYRLTNSVDPSASVLLPEEHTTSLDSLVLQTGENSGSATAESGDLATLSPVEMDPYGLIPTSEYAFDPTQEQSGVTSPDSSTLDDRVEQEAGGTVDSLPEVSMGSTDEVLTVTYNTGSSEASGVHEGMLDVTLLTSPIAITYSPPTQRSVEAEASSPGDFITFIPESSVPSGFDPLEEGLEKVEQEGLGEIPEVVETTTPETASGEEGSGDEQNGQEVSGDEKSGQEASGDEESGQEASGDEESGQEASGDEESGQEASGDEESSQEASGDEESGQEASGQEASGQEASGDEESGQEVSGDEKSGQEASGDKESGQEASGDKESGQEASGDEKSGQEASGDKESGQEASGDKESGQEASGDEKSGQEASGDKESGQEASGDEESGQEASGDKESGQEASGDKESGQEASGDEKSGQEASGDKESGQEASGDEESGQEASGDKESGQEASGDKESGQEASGDKESGQEASGDEKSGQEASGDKESGQEASGDEESGQEASGDKESGQEASGDKESGQEASGDEKSGQEASVDKESGQEASGDDESGQEASGDEESVQEASGDEESGQEASGDEESGQEASGEEESGQEASGDEESGQEASGDEESGQEASGDKESGQEVSGNEDSDQEVSGQEGVESGTGSGSGEEHSASAESGESSGILEPEVPYINETVTPINGTTVNGTDESEPESSTDAPSTDMEVTLLPDLSQTPVPSPTVPQESRADADLEYSGETSVTEDPDSITPPTKEPEETSSPTPTTEDYDDQTTTAAPLYPEDYDDQTTTAAPLYPEDYDDQTTTAAAQDVDEEKLITTPTTPRFGNISDACLDNPCSNGGTCVDSGSSTKCLCLPTYGGDMCQTDLEVCEPGWEKFMGFCYRHFTKRQGWEVAEQQCRLCGAHLISVMTPEEQDYINDKYREYQWMGLNDRTIEGDFRWSDGNPLLYENWYRGQPDSYFLSGEDCVVMVWHDGGRWSDVPCNYHLSYTCKKGTSFCGQPPVIANAKVFGKSHLRYETNSKVRYYCEEGFLQTQNPVIKCLSNGQWEEALITCHPALTDLAEREQKVTTPPYQNEGVEVVDTATEKATSEFWDIKWN
ncbi:aggrecan core protein isoform X3 [Salmo salar]|uniref:Aggrecan core protein isoform X3 n=1 Tax=Salmo salar TaxID=8030 RepID=A0A1S3NR03_SALSA|nr:aggrecan core protein-like isoform X3 [Salmo salar]